MRILSIVVVLVLWVAPASSQAVRPSAKSPSPEALSAAHKACADMFANLTAGKTEVIASWIAEEIGYTRDPASKITLKNEFKSKLDLVVTSPPVTPYGKLSGYDLLDEAYLPNSNRYFRLAYISYHEGAPLIWEFRFYVKPDGKISLNHIEWSEKNPFEYMSTSEMAYPNPGSK